jgi:glycosyltransferase involved in cell wall biosynthesis
MKVLVAHNFYKQPGGEDQCFAAEVALLRAHGHEVIPYSVHNDSVDALTNFQRAARTIWARPGYRAVRDLIRTHRPQIAHFHNTFPLISPAAYYAARAEKVRVVQTLHNFRLLCPNALLFRAGKICEECLGKSVPWPGIVHKCYRDSRTASTGVAAMLVTHRALGTWQHAVDRYIALTELGRQKFIAGGLPAARISVKANFVTPDPGVGAGSGKYAVFVGRLAADKGVTMMLEAWKELGGSLPLKIVGDGPLAPMVQQAAEISGAQWLGRKSLDEVYGLIGEAMFLVLPSQGYEGFPRVIVEAFARGTPILASRLGAMAEIVEHGRTGLHFEPGNARDLVVKARELAGDPQRLARMRQAARQEYEQKYTAAVNYRALLAIYEHALGGEQNQREPN